MISPDISNNYFKNFPDTLKNYFLGVFLPIESFSYNEHLLYRTNITVFEAHIYPVKMQMWPNMNWVCKKVSIGC